MNIKIVFVVFCIFQVAFGQEDPETDLQDLIDQITTEFGNHVIPLQDRHQAFLNNITEEALIIDSLRGELRDEVESLGSELNSNGIDISECLSPALDNVTAIVDDEVEELEAFATIELNNLNLVINDVYLLVEEEVRLLRRTRQSLQNCKELAALEETNACINILISTFDLTKGDIIDRLVEQRNLGENVLNIAEENFNNLTADNQNYIDNHMQDVREELAICIGNL